MSKIKENLDTIEQNIEKSCSRSTRKREDVQLVIVTKASDIEEIKEVYDLGYRVFGENRLPHLKEMFERMSEYAPFADPVRWEMIGHMQRNKVKSFLPLVDRVHSMDSMRLAIEMEKVAASMERSFEVFIQVNCSGEDCKYGIEPSQAADIAEEVNEKCPSIKLVGLMTMAEFTDDTSRITRAFRLARKTFEDIKATGGAGGYFSRLSMGMTNDYEIAIMEGATDIRVGSAVFN